MGMSNLSAAVVAGAMAMGPGADAKNFQDLSAVSGPTRSVDRSEFWRAQGAAALKAEPPTAGILSGVIPDNRPQTLVKPSLTPQQLVENFAGKFKEAGYTVEKLPEGAGYWIRRGQEEIKISIGNPNDALGGAVDITQNGKPISLSIGLAAEMRDGKEVSVFILKFRDRETGKITTIGKIEGAIQLATSENLGLGLLTTNVANGQSHQMLIPHQVGPTGGICIQPETNVAGQAATNSICTQLQPVPPLINTSVSTNPAPVHINPTSVNINPSVSGSQPGQTYTSVSLHDPSNVFGPSNGLVNQPQTGFGINLLEQPVWNYGPYLQQPLGPVNQPSNVNVGPNAVTGHISADPSSTVNVGTNNLGVK